MNPFVTNKNPDTQASQVYRLLETQIVLGELAPGQELSERSISTQFQIGRTPVREALQKLAANQMVQVEPRRGTFVSPITAEIAAELFYVVWPLERLVMRRAIERGSDQELQSLGELAATLASLGPGGKQTSLYGELNNQIEQAARNPYLVAVLVPMRMLLERIRFFYGLATDHALCEAFSDLAMRIAARDDAGGKVAFASYSEMFQGKAMAEIVAAGGSPSKPTRKGFKRSNTLQGVL